MEEERTCRTSLRGAPENNSGFETPSPNVSTSGSEEAQQNPKSDSQLCGFFCIFKKGPCTGSNTFHPSPSRRKTRNSRHIKPSLSLDTELYCSKPSWKNFLLSELQTATNNFSRENLIGEGGYSEVYKGHLQDGQLVAIKRLIRGAPEAMTAEFLSELGISVHVNHPNVANIIGYGVEGGMHLVLPLSPHGSLASLLTGAKEKLKWSIRYKIALGTAEGLSYLHEECRRRIIHRDIKAANILLTEDFEPQISDFGLAKWLPDQWTHLTISQFEGTFGYLPPEFFMHGLVDEKTDVYSYGVLLLELITGRLALDKSHQSLLIWARPMVAKNDIRELVDPSLDGAYDSEQMNQMILIASQCIHRSSIERPQMSKALRMLKGGEGGSLEGVYRFQRRPVIRRTYSLEVVDAEECNSLKCLTDMNQQMEI
ncbi:receptor-like cytosolic serine/threonine-protein kinase RBK2 isoform X2 [Cornus florida]|nr:receptor-like cytosolic serine/threonine-protein kinase RBK2 isoform X2 [Cornus florida]